MKSFRFDTDFALPLRKGVEAQIILDGEELIGRISSSYEVFSGAQLAHYVANTWVREMRDELHHVQNPAYRHIRNLIEDDMMAMYAENKEWQRRGLLALSYSSSLSLKGDKYEESSWDYILWCGGVSCYFLKDEDGWILSPEEARRRERIVVDEVYSLLLGGAGGRRFWRGEYFALGAMLPAETSSEGLLPAAMVLLREGLKEGRGFFLKEERRGEEEFLRFFSGLEAFFLGGVKLESLLNIFAKERGFPLLRKEDLVPTKGFLMRDPNPENILKALKEEGGYYIE